MIAWSKVGAMIGNTIINSCYEKALQLLERNSRPEGFVASSARPHYAALWSRDACITSIGANVTGISGLLKISRSTLVTLSKLQAITGQVPAAYWPQHSYWDWGEAGAVDSQAWFIVAAWHYYKMTADETTLKALYPSIKRAFTWLQLQDPGNFGLVESPEAGDWMDSTLNRCGKVMYVNVLYYLAAKAIAELAKKLGDDTLQVDVEAIRFKFNLLFWPSLEHEYAELLRHVDYPAGAKIDFPHWCSVKAFREAAKRRRYYLSHVAYGRFADVCDVLGNSLAIIAGLPDGKRTELMMDYFAREKVAQPYPAKSLAKPVTQKSDRWGMFKSSVEKFQAREWRNPPFCYHNAGVWPFIGGFYVLAVLKSGAKELALHELEHLACANRLGIETEWEFREWINAKTAKPAGAAYQSWNASTYIMAYKAVEEGISDPLYEIGQI
jgi:glycogen debranching enzyme